MWKRLAWVVTLAACGGTRAPAAPPPDPPRAREKKVTAEDLSKAHPPPRDTMESCLSHDDEPVVECRDDPALATVAIDPLPHHQEPDDRGWIDFGEPIYRAGCVPPTTLRSAFDEIRAAMFACFVEASPEAFSVRVRAHIEPTPAGLIRFSAELRFPQPGTVVHDCPDPAAEVDEERLRGCLDRALSSLEQLHGEVRLPAVVDLPVDRGIPAEAGVAAPPPPGL